PPKHAAALANLTRVSRVKDPHTSSHSKTARSSLAICTHSWRADCSQARRKVSTRRLLPIPVDHTPSRRCWRTRRDGGLSADKHRCAQRNRVDLLRSFARKHHGANLVGGTSICRHLR